MPSYLSRKIHQAAVVGAAALMVSSVACGTQGGPGAGARDEQPVAHRRRSRTRRHRHRPDGAADGDDAARRHHGADVGLLRVRVAAGSGHAGPGRPVRPSSRPRGSLSIALTNSLPVPTSLVVLGQLGGGLGTPQKMDGPAHNGQNFTTFPGNSSTASKRLRAARRRGSASARSGPRSPRARPRPSPGTSLKPGTYIYETGTLPSLQVPMGLYGVLVVTTAPTSTNGVFTPGTAYPGLSYDADTALLFSELDVVRTRRVDAAAVADADVNFRNDPSCSTTNTCAAAYPAAVNYSPTYFLINGQFFDRTAPQNSAFPLAHRELQQRQRPRATPQRRLADARPRRSSASRCRSWPRTATPPPETPSSRPRCSSPPARPTTRW